MMAMKIVRKDTCEMVAFEALPLGAVFIEIVDDGMEYIQIKMATIEADEDYNAVSLVTGEPYHIDPHTEVKKVEAELIIRNLEVGA